MKHEIHNWIESWGDDSDEILIDTAKYLVRRYQGELMIWLSANKDIHIPADYLREFTKEAGLEVNPDFLSNTTKSVEVSK